MSHSSDPNAMCYWGITMLIISLIGCIIVSIMDIKTIKWYFFRKHDIQPSKSIFLTAIVTLSLSFFYLFFQSLMILLELIWQIKINCFIWLTNYTIAEFTRLFMYLFFCARYVLQLIVLLSICLSVYLSICLSILCNFGMVHRNNHAQ